MKRLLCLFVLLVSMTSCRRLIELNTDNSPVWVENARTWDHMPLTVDWSGLKNSAFDSSFKDAMKVWNRAVGRDLLVRAQPGQHADVVVMYYEGAPCGNNSAHPLDAKAEAATFYCPDGTAEVQFRYTSDVVTTYLAAVHEFGHVLGLAHNKRGIMAPVVYTNDPAALNGGGLQMAPLIFPWSKHVKALKERYAK